MDDWEGVKRKRRDLQAKRMAHILKGGSFEHVSTILDHVFDPEIKAGRRIKRKLLESGPYTHQKSIFLDRMNDEEQRAGL